MTSERNERIERLFEQAAAIRPDERRAFLDRECADDPEIRSRLDSLLRGHEAMPTAFLAGETPSLGAMPGGDTPGDDTPGDDTPGDDTPGGDTPDGDTPGPIAQKPAMVLGRYTILGKIGEGGMGVVYEAKQENPSRTVALKVLRPGLASESMLRRFDHEAQTLGRLRHPGIAQIYEAGTADAAGAHFGETDSWPFFAMELVRGVALDRHVDDHGLDDRERLGLVAEICDAVQHAHQNGVIHRDLKPANILIDTDGQPKVLDFGVARLTDTDLTMTSQTEVGQVIGTLSYMSPEQLSGDPDAIDTRSDIYAVGVILYALLCGRLPHEVQGRSLAEVARMIQEDEPRPIAAIEPRFAGDVATIVATAMAKDKERRYESIAELAGDIRRYLNHQPIVARPPTTLYVLRKFARRHRALVTGAALAVVSLVTGLAFAIYGLLEAVDAGKVARTERDAATSARDAERDQRIAAEAQARRSRRTTEFLQHMLTRRNPEHSGGKDVTVLEVLDDSASTVAEELAEDPEVEAAIRFAIGQAYKSLGRYDEAEAMLERALEIRTDALDPRSEDMASLLDGIAMLRRLQGRLDEALATSEEALRLATAHGRPDSVLTLSILENRGDILQALGRTEEAEAIARDALDRRMELHGQDHFMVAYNKHNLGVVLSGRSKYDEAEPLLREALAWFRNEFGRLHPATSEAIANLGLVLYATRRFDEATDLAAESIEITRELLGAQHAHHAQALQHAAAIDSATERYARAEARLREALAIYEASLGSASPQVGSVKSALAKQLTAQGKNTEAEPLLRTAIAQLREAGSASPDLAWALQRLADNLAAQGRSDEAESTQREALDIMRAVYGDDHHDSVLMLSYLGRILYAMGDLRGTERVTRDVLEAYRRILGDDHPDVTSTLYNLATIRIALADWGAAEPLAREAIERFRAQYGDEHAYVTAAMAKLGEILRQLDRPEEAKQALRDVFERTERMRGVSHTETNNAFANLLSFLLERSDHAEAEALLLGRYEALSALDSARSLRRACRRSLVRLYETWGKPEQAAEWSQPAR